MNRFIGLAVLGLVLAGCSTGPKDPTGSYEATMTVPDAVKKDPMAAQMMGDGTSKLDLKKDKTFTLTTGTLPMEGKWSVEGTTLTLNIEKAMGMDMTKLKEMAAAAGQSNPELGKPQTATLQSDGTILMTGGGQQLVFKKK